MNNHQEIVEEETPQLRSVKIGSLTAPPSLSRSFVSPIKLQEQSSCSHASVVVTEATQSLSSIHWSVDDHLPALPADYMLERSNVYINNCNSQEVADRITSALNVESIASSVCSDEKNVLRAQTNHGCRFLVRLFSEESSIVVEVQRLTGCSYAFRQACRSICKSARGADVGAGTRKRKLTVPSSIPRASQQQKEERILSDFESAKNMLKSNRLDSQLMGLEIIESLSASPCVTCAILGEECLEVLLQHVEIPEPTSDIQQEHASLMRRRSLTILANGLLAGTVEIPSELSCEAFARKLLVCLQKSAQGPHEACQAARCLQALTKSNTSMQGLLHELNTLSILSSVSKNHSDLQEEAKRLRMVLTR